ncbi:glutamate decarboxylase [Acetobacter orientalis]|uniref:Glutamate decarboxylase n=1 Tax=Acetobacter orientalis TaxID=146474 RepID=A0A2Z5ZGR5_9PROT|nr:glutamate decarboxylase [Acetobacter orientalis]
MAAYGYGTRLNPLIVPPEYVYWAVLKGFTPLGLVSLNKI